MANENILVDKSLKFGAIIFKLEQELLEKQEHRISSELVSSVSNIGLCVSKALCGISRSDFLTELVAAVKAAASAEYWIRMLRTTGYISQDQTDLLLSYCLELKRLITSAIANTRTGGKEDNG